MYHVGLLFLSLPPLLLVQESFAFTELCSACSMPVGGLIWQLCVLHILWLYACVDSHEVVVVSCCSMGHRISRALDWGKSPGSWPGTLHADSKDSRVVRCVLLGANNHDIHMLKVKHYLEFIIILCFLTFCHDYLLPNFWIALVWSVLQFLRHLWSYVKFSYVVTSHETLHILHILCLLTSFCFVEPFITY
jgi:hypothetical protein